MISGNHFRLYEERCLRGNNWRQNLPIVDEVDELNCLRIDNVTVWKIDDGNNVIYRISIPGLTVETYDDGIMVRGKRIVRDVLNEYRKNNVTISEQPLYNYLTDDQQNHYADIWEYHDVLSCLIYLREIERKLNSVMEPGIKVRVRKVKRGK